jgi:hypothetical protein
LSVLAMELHVVGSVQKWYRAQACTATAVVYSARVSCKQPPPPPEKHVFELLIGLLMR